MDEQDEVVVLPPVPLDPIFAEAVEDALAGEQVPTSAIDPERALGSDPHDFAGLYIRHRSAFALHARRFLRDSRDVDEVVQEAFLRLFLALPELTSELQALAYCRRTVTNLCIDRYRADQRRPRLVDLESVPADVLTDHAAGDPVIQAEDAAMVREALALLTPLHRDALVKREIEEKTLPTIAAELGVAEDSVKHLLHRARRSLRRHLAATNLAPGAALDDVSTLSLLARSAVAGTGRVGVLALLFVALAAGATSVRAPHDVVQTLTGLLTPAPSPRVTAAARPQAAAGAPARSGAPRAVAGPAPISAQVPPGLFTDDRDAPGPVVAPLEPAAAPVVPPAAAVRAAVPGAGAATPTASTATSPSPTPTASVSPAAPSSAPEPTPDPVPVPTLSPSLSPSPDAEPSADLTHGAVPVQPGGSLGSSGSPSAPAASPTVTVTSVPPPTLMEPGLRPAAKHVRRRR